MLQIRDWLAVEEEMLRKQAVVVGDVGEIMEALDKQMDVLRELGQKKPQLDELVHTAEALRADTNRQQVHGKVTKLREHWDEMNSKMMQRKTELDAMLGDSQRYEAKRNEVEVWLARMETRLEKMRASATPPTFSRPSSGNKSRSTPSSTSTSIRSSSSISSRRS